MNVMIRALSVCIVCMFCVTASPEPAVTPYPTPNDPLFGEQYYFEKMDVLQAWSMTRGSKDVVIGVIEAGFDPGHEDLRGGNVSVYEVPGFHQDTGWPDNNHGTQVVGEIAATPNNGIGIAGLAPQCGVLVAKTGIHDSLRRYLKDHKAEDATEWNRLSAAKDAEAIRYLADHGCKVINCSFGFVDCTAIKDALDRAAKCDVVVVIAAGNSAQSSVPSVATKPGVLCVGGSDVSDKLWKSERSIQGRTVVTGSNYGPGLSVLAPCSDLVYCMARDKKVWDSLPPNTWADTPMGKARRGYMLKQGGTSNSAPMVSALVGLIRSLRPDLSCVDVVKVVCQGADDLETKGWDETTGFGRVNFHRSLQIARAWPRAQRKTAQVPPR